ncbi:MAG: GNAT family N-acetyltransferase [Magnetococcus sp. WYHC-3]
MALRLFENFYKALNTLEEAEKEFKWEEMALSVSKEGSDANFLLYNPKILKRLSDYNAKEFIQKAMNLGGVVATIVLEKHKKDCFGAWEVLSSAVNEDLQGQGIGTKMYKIVMAYLGEPITSDRYTVSKSAREVWKKLEKDPLAVSLPPEQGEYQGAFDDKKHPVTPPKKDDCAIYAGGKDNPMNKAYAPSSDMRGEYSNLISQLITNHDSFVRSWKELMAVWRSVDFLLLSLRLFRREYYHEED